LNEPVAILHCKMGKIHFVYLGLPIGGNPRRLSFWELVVNRIKSRLSGWQSRFLSFGGRLILLKFVLTVLPVYALSFFKAPSGIISSIKSLLINFFFFGAGAVRTLENFLGRVEICVFAKGVQRVGVRQLKEFNEALLGKWCWTMLVDRDGLWYRMLVPRYGEEDGRLEDGC